MIVWFVERTTRIKWIQTSVLHTHTPTKSHRMSVNLFINRKFHPIKELNELEPCFFISFIVVVVTTTAAAAAFLIVFFLSVCVRLSLSHFFCVLYNVRCWQNNIELELKFLSGFCAVVNWI